MQRQWMARHLASKQLILNDIQELKKDWTESPVQSFYLSVAEATENLFYFYAIEFSSGAPRRSVSVL